MKMEMFRYSGRPVTMAAIEAYDSDWRLFYDKAAEKAGLDMLKLKRYLSYGERLLMKKHGVKTEIELPKTVKQWAALLAAYEGLPIMVAERMDKKGLVLVIKDSMD